MRLCRPDRKGALLITVGVLEVILGASYIAAPSPALKAALIFALHLAPLWAWGALWLCCGLWCLASPFLRPRPSPWDFLPGTFPPSLWGGMYIVGPLFGDTLTFRGIASGVIFWALAVFVYLSAGLIDPARLLRREGDEPEGRPV